MQQFLREKVNPKCQTALFIDTYRSGDGYFACGEYSAPCRLQAGLTRSAVRMRTRVCVRFSAVQKASRILHTNRGDSGSPAKKGAPRVGSPIFGAGDGNRTRSISLGS